MEIVLGYWNENSDSCFRFNNPKQFSNWIILVPSCSSHLAIKISTVFILRKFQKIDLKIQKSLCITTKTCTQIQNFKRNYLENDNDSEHAVKTKNAPFFMNFSNINKNGTFSRPDWSMGWKVEKSWLPELFLVVLNGTVLFFGQPHDPVFWLVF